MSSDPSYRGTMFELSPLREGDPPPCGDGARHRGHRTAATRAGSRGANGTDVKKKERRLPTEGLDGEKACGSARADEGLQLKLDGWVTVAVRREPLRKRVIVKCLSGPGSHNELYMLQHIRHNRFRTVLDVFKFEGSFYVIFERLAISLTQVVTSTPYPGEQELAAIMGQARGFLRTHQASAVVVAYASWRHLPSQLLFPRMYIYISAALFLSTSILQCGSVLWRNGTVGHGSVRALIGQAFGTVQISVRLSRPLKVDAGQYINLWVPSVSFWSFLQSHPFVVTSWTDEKQDTLELFVEPRRGWTRELLSSAGSSDGTGAPRSRWAMFSGPHGISAPVGEYGSVLMVATGLGMAAQLPYLKQLLHGYQARKVFIHRIRVLWQVQRIDTALAMEPLLNKALQGDKLDKILFISIFSTHLKEDQVSFGRRGAVYRGSADVRDILRAEVTRRHPKGTLTDIEAVEWALLESLPIMDMRSIESQIPQLIWISSSVLEQPSRWHRGKN